MTTPPRPDFIRNLDEVPLTGGAYPGDTELMSDGHAIGRAVGLKSLGVHVELLAPGRRTSWPHAESLEEEFVLVLEGHPTAWLDGQTYPLRPGDAVGLPAGTGITHTFINDTDGPVRLVVVGERRAENQIYYPMKPEGYEGMTPERRWTSAPSHPLGPHDGRPSALHRDRR
jgi:uncharacterized cupin superfamily protein